LNGKGKNKNVRWISASKGKNQMLGSKGKKKKRAFYPFLHGGKDVGAFVKHWKNPRKKKGEGKKGGGRTSVIISNKQKKLSRERRLRGFCPKEQLKNIGKKKKEKRFHCPLQRKSNLRKIPILKFKRKRSSLIKDEGRNYAHLKGGGRRKTGSKPRWEGGNLHMRKKVTTPVVGN